MRFAIEIQFPTQNVGITPKAPPPGRVTQDENRSGSKPRICLGKVTPKEGTDTKHSKEVVRNEVTIPARGFSLTGQSPGSGELHRERLKRLVQALPVEKIEGGRLVACGRSRSFPDRNNALWGRVGQRLEKDSIKQTEHRTVGADAKAQHADHSGSEGWISPEGSKAIAEVSEKILYPTETPLIAMGLLDQCLQS